MTTTFLLIRHAAHVHLDKLFSGRMPGVPLSEAGRAQAVRLGRALAGGSIDRIVHSPLDRTRETAAAIAAARLPSPPVEALAGLIEIDMGDWTGRSWRDFGDDPAWAAWNERRGSARIPGGETMGEAQARIVACLAALASGADGQTIVVVTHSDMVRGAVAHVLGLSLDRLLAFDVDVASVTRVVWGDWGARLLGLNARPA